MGRDGQGLPAAGRVLLVAAAAVLVAGGLGAVTPTAPHVGRDVLPWWLIALATAAVEVRVLHLQVRREARTISLSELPLLLGLVFAGPVALVVGKTTGALAVYALHRRQRPLKLVLNTAAALVETAAALLAYAAVLSAVPAPEGPWLWAAGYAGATAAAVVSHATVSAAIAAFEGRLPRLREQRAALTVPLLTAWVITTVGLVAVHALLHDARSGLLLGGVVLVLLAGYRAYADLVDRHRSLERLHAFSRAVSGTEPDEVLRSALAQTCELLQAEQAVVHLVGADGEDDLVVLSRPDGGVEQRPDAARDDPQGVRAEVLRTGRPALAARSERDARLRGHLAAVGHRDAVVVVLPDPTGEPVGTLTVAGRRGDVRSFAREDVRLLETVAAHVGATLQSGRLLSRLRHDQAHDALTGLSNRARLLRHAAACLEVARGDGSRTALVVLDIDGFKDVNDGLGNASGDALLRAVAERLQRAAPAGATAARLGGDQFAVLVPGAGGPDVARALAEALRATIAEPLTVRGVTVQVTATAGVALAPDHATDADTLVQHGDLALSDARTAGAGVRVYERGADAAGPERLALLADLRQALADRGLAVHVQPKARLADGRVVGVEALVRWAHPHLGPVYPDVFVPLAERNGLIGALTSFVLEASVEAAVAWHAAGTPLNVAVNLSPRSLVDDAVVDEVLALLARTGLPAHLLTLEVTEGSVIADPDRAVRLLGRLREAGVRLALDDFGTGYSSLSHLKRLPVHEVKIDRGFVMSMGTDTDDAAIVRSIVDLGSNLDLEVVAEGVEDQAGWDALAGLGCDLAQGYHLARPMPLGDLAGWLAAYDARRLVAALPAPRAAGQEHPDRVREGLRTRVE